MSGTVIRTLAREDVPAVAEVDRLCFTCPWTGETFDQEATSAIGYYRVAEADGEVVGFIGSHMVLDEAHITTLGVHPRMRRRGIGERLLLDVLRQAVRSGCRRITLEVRESNLEAQCLYRRYGFSPVSRRPRYYPDNNEDAIVMWVEDTSRAGFRAVLEERLRAFGEVGV